MIEGYSAGRAQTVPRHDLQHRLGRHVRGGFSNVLAGSPRRPEHSQTRGVGLISSPGHETGYLGPRGDAWRARGGAYLVRLAVRGGLWRERVLGGRAHAHGHPSGREGRRHGDRCGTLVLGLPTRSCTRRWRERCALGQTGCATQSVVRPRWCVRLLWGCLRRSTRWAPRTALDALPRCRTPSKETTRVDPQDNTCFGLKLLP